MVSIRDSAISQNECILHLLLGICHEFCLDSRFKPSQCLHKLGITVYSMLPAESHYEFTCKSVDAVHCLVAQDLLGTLTYTMVT